MKLVKPFNPEEVFELYKVFAPACLNFITNEIPSYDSVPLDFWKAKSNLSVSHFTKDHKVNQKSCEKIEIDHVDKKCFMDIVFSLICEM